MIRPHRKRKNERKYALIIGNTEYIDPGLAQLTTPGKDYDLFNQKKPDDLLVLYFSGHGVRDELGALYSRRVSPFGAAALRRMRPCVLTCKYGGLRPPWSDLHK